MGFKYSTGYRNFKMNGGSFQRAFQNGELRLYSGTQPSSPDNAPTGCTLLCTITSASGTRTAEVCGAGSVVLAGSSGSVDNITVNSVELLAPNQFSAAVSVAFNSTLTQTAIDVCTQINKGSWWHGYNATSSVATITLTKLPGFGDSINGDTVAANCTTLTPTPSNVANGVDPANGIQFGATASGAITKSGTWSGTNAANGTVTWARFIGSIADASANSTTLIRVDMDVATAGTIMTMSSTTLTANATTTIDSVSITHPAS